jgi:hypothetical protein
MNKISGVAMLLIYVFVATALLASENFVQPYNLQNILRWSSYFGIIGIGAAIVIITGGIDLSIGSVIALAGCSIPMMLVQWQWSTAAALALAMAIALLVGLFNGLLITKVKLPPFIVTLCGLLICRGYARWLTNDQTQGLGSVYDDSLRLLAIGKPCSFALVVMVLGAVTAMWFLLNLIRSYGVPDFGSRRAQAACGLAGGMVLAIIGSSRFWWGYEVTTGGQIDLLFDWKMTTWKATVPESGVLMPGELMWWCGLGMVPSAIWFAMVGLRAKSWHFRETANHSNSGPRCFSPNCPPWLWGMAQPEGVVGISLANGRSFPFARYFDVVYRLVFEKWTARRARVGAHPRHPHGWDHHPLARRPFLLAARDARRISLR